MNQKVWEDPRTQNFGHLNNRWRMANKRSYQDGEDNRQTVSGDRRGSSNSTTVSKRTVRVIYIIPRYTAHTEKTQQTHYRNWCIIHSRIRFVFLLPPAQEQTTHPPATAACIQGHLSAKVGPGWRMILGSLSHYFKKNVQFVFILFIVILQYIICQHNNIRVNVYCNMFGLRRVIIRLII